MVGIGRWITRGAGVAIGVGLVATAHRAACRPWERSSSRGCRREDDEEDEQEKDQNERQARGLNTHEEPDRQRWPA